VAKTGGVRIFILAEGAAPAPILEALSGDLLALVGVAAAHVDRRAQDRGTPAARYDPALWQAALMHLPLLGPSSFDVHTATRTVEGDRLPDDLLAQGLGAAGTPLLPESEFRSFLAQREEVIRTGVLGAPDGFTVVAVWMTVEAVPSGSGDRSPVARVATSLATFTAAPAPDGSTTAFALAVRRAVSLFDYERLQDEAVRREFDAILQQSPRENLRESGDFFAGTLPSEE